MIDLFEYRDGMLFWKQARGKAKVGKRAGTVTKGGYRHIQYNRKIYKEHRLIWEMHNGPIPEGMYIDHINRNPSDNHIENLQLVTPGENNWNRGAKGYCLESASGKYMAEIWVDGKRHWLGRYDNESDARTAYLEAKEKHHDRIQIQRERTH